MIDFDYVRFFFKYYPETGKFVRIRAMTWKRNIVECNREITSLTGYGYYQVNLDGNVHLVHRLIWLWMTGNFPEEDVDHINGIRTDNRWCNLRKVTRKENLRNVGLRNDNTSGKVGVSYRKDTGKWFAYIWNEGKRKGLGTHSSFEKACEIRDKAEKELNFHINHGKRKGYRNEN